MIKLFKHFKVIYIHKKYVVISCFKAGILWQGITHDLSKLSITELRPALKHYRGTSSPINEERIVQGYSMARQHHKGRNKHHWHYWVDIDAEYCTTIKIPPKYISEMICDWIAAGKTYSGDTWDVSMIKEYYDKNRDRMILHPFTKKILDDIVNNLRSEKQLYMMLKPKSIELLYEVYETNNPSTKDAYMREVKVSGIETIYGKE